MSFVAFACMISCVKSNYLKGKEKYKFNDLLFMVEVIIVEINKNGFITYLMRYDNIASFFMWYLFLALSSI